MANSDLSRIAFTRAPSPVIRARIVDNDVPRITLVATLCRLQGGRGVVQRMWAHGAVVNIVARGTREALAVAAFLPRAFVATLRGPPFIDTLLLTLRLVTTSAPVVFAVVFFGGAMLTVQAAASLTPMGGADMAGLVVGFGGIREVFPLLAAAAIAARSGAEFASELGTMRTTQQIDALEVMGIEPLRALAGPRIVAAVLGAPLCVLVACGAGMLGSQAVGAFQLGIDRGSMWARLWSGVVTEDLYVAAGKGAVLGFLLAAIAVREGLVATGGAAGVGRATNKAVVRAMIAVCAVSLLLTSLVYGRFA